jgi:iron complex transport system substrate-binding protein
MLFVGLTSTSFAGRPNEDGVGTNEYPPSPRRILTIAPNAAEILCELGLADRIVGVSKFCVYPPELKDKPRVGGLFDPDLEKIAALRPDLVVLRGRNLDVEQLCGKLGVTVYHDPTEKLADLKRCIRDLGRLTGRTEQAERLVTTFESRIDAIRSRVKDRPRPKVLLVISRDIDQVSKILTSGQGTFIDEMIRIAGGTNVFGHLEMDYPEVSAESILVLQPQVIIEIMPERALTAQEREAMIDQWAVVGPLPAVQRRSVHFLTRDNAENALIPSPRYVEVIELVSRWLHPDSTRER